MSLLIKAGTLSTDVRANGSSKLSVEFFIADSTTGQGKTGLTKASFTKFGLSLAGGAVVDYTSTMVDLTTYGDAYTSKGFKEKDAAKDPGRYRFDIPVADAANIANGSLSWVLSGALDAGDATGTEIAFVNYDPDSLDPNVALIKAKTDLIPAAGPADAAHYTNARGDKLDELDAAVSTRLATSGYTAPDNTTIGTVNTKIGTPAVTVSADIATRAATGAAMTLTSGERTSIAAAAGARSIHGMTMDELLGTGAFNFVIAAGTMTIKHADGSTIATRTIGRDLTALLAAIISAT